jgi:hypothetical protein
MKTLPLIFLAFMFLATGCSKHPEPSGCEKVIHKKTICPKFNTRLSIYAEELNSTHAAVKWTDIARIESCIKRKKEFNKKVDSLNK